MAVVDYVLDLLAHHPKLSQGVALTTTGVSGAVQYVERSMGIAPESWSEVGIVVGVFASLLVVYANYRRLRYEAQQNGLDAEIKRLEIKRIKLENLELEDERKKRRISGEPMRRKDD